jgi:hypothetical protein
MFAESLMGRKLEPIRKFLVEHHTRQGFKAGFKRIALHRTEASQIADQREKLTHALAEFGVSV